jgi:hypothetical protein
MLSQEKYNNCQNHWIGNQLKIPIAKAMGIIKPWRFSFG